MWMLRITGYVLSGSNHLLVRVVLVKSAFRAFRFVPASLTDFLSVQDFRDIFENKLNAFGHGHSQRPGNPSQGAG